MNNELNIQLTGLQNLISAMKLTENIFKSIEAYKVEKNTMVLYWHAEGKNIQKLPYIMNSEQAAQFVWGWLEQTKPIDPEPYTDGSTGLGWELNARGWTIWEGDTYSFITISPVWFVYGK